VETGALIDISVPDERRNSVCPSDVILAARAGAIGGQDVTPYNSTATADPKTDSGRPFERHKRRTRGGTDSAVERPVPVGWL
jgi:hypothetical protein